MVSNALLPTLFKQDPRYFYSGALSNLYYPAEDRRSARLTFENAAIGIGGAAVGNVFQEFLFRKLTTHSHRSTEAAKQRLEPTRSSDRTCQRLGARRG